MLGEIKDKMRIFAKEFREQKETSGNSELRTITEIQPQFRCRSKDNEAKAGENTKHAERKGVKI